MSVTRISLKARALHLPYALLDARNNRRWATAAERFLIVRHSGKQPYRYAYFLDWLEKHVPEARARFELRLLPCQIRDWSQYCLYVPWLQDPVEDWSPSAHLEAQVLASYCDARGIPVINRVERLSNSVKSVGARLIRNSGIRTPRVIPIKSAKVFRETLCGLPLPLLVREDRGHGAESVFVNTHEEAQAVPLEKFVHPIAVEFIDVRSPADGLWRKYRYVGLGDSGVTRHLIIADHWEVRPKHRVLNDATRAEELAYLEGSEPHEERLQAARRALGFDVVAFDYSYDREGGLVVWEANPYPDLSYPKNEAVQYTFPFVERSFAAVTRLYFQRAGLKIPAKLDDMLATPNPNRRASAA